MMNKMFNYLRKQTHWEIETFEGETNVTYYTTNGGEETITLFKGTKTPKAFLNQMRNYYNDFDVDDFVSMWLEAKGNGVPGVPGAVELVKDAQEIDGMLADLVAHTEMFIEQNKLQVGDIATIRNTDNNKINDQRVEVKKIFNDLCVVTEIGKKEEIYTLEENLEKLDQENKYTVFFGAGMGYFLLSLEVEGKNYEEALRNATEKLYLGTNKGGHYIDDMEEIAKKEDDPYYKEDYLNFLSDNPDGDFGQFLEEKYNYIYIDTPNEGPLYIKHGEGLKILEGWGINTSAIKIDENIPG